MRHGVKAMATQSHAVSAPRWAPGSCIVVVCALLFGLGACRQVLHRRHLSSSRSRPRRPGHSGGSPQFKVSAEESLLQILVYRGGAMARMVTTT